MTLATSDLCHLDSSNEISSQLAFWFQLAFWLRIKKSTNRFSTWLLDLIVLGFNNTSRLVGDILCCLPQKDVKEIEEIVEMKERDKEERGTGMKVKKQKK